jgi:hypothetical protein
MTTGIPPDLRSHLNGSLLGRLRLLAWRNMAGAEGVYPGQQRIVDSLLALFRENTTAGHILSSVLSVSSTHAMRYSELTPPRDIGALLSYLQDRPLTAPLFAEVTDCPVSLPSTLGILVSCSRAADSGQLYELAVLAEEAFPESIAGFVVVRANRERPSLPFSVLKSGGYDRFGSTNWHTHPLLGIALGLLNAVPRIQPEEQEIPIGNLDPRDNLRPPHDDSLQDLLHHAYQGELPCSRASVRLDSIRPFDLDFCLSFPLNVIDAYARRIASGRLTALLVYWEGDSFLMSDDYPAYLAYRKLGSSIVPVTILGHFPHKAADVEEVGGSNLIPPVGVVVHDDYESLPRPLKESLLDQRLAHMNITPPPKELLAVFVRLAELLQNSTTTERQLQSFFVQHPIALDVYGLKLIPEVRLGRRYRIDLVVQHGLLHKQLELVELESPSARIFTKTGRLRAKVVHACQQIEDWLRWWRENPRSVPPPFDSSTTPEGLVVIGRRTGLDDESKSRLIHLNSTRHVKIATYDDLLDRIENLIRSLVGDPRGGNAA